MPLLSSHICNKHNKHLVSVVQGAVLFVVRFEKDDQGGFIEMCVLLVMCINKYIYRRIRMCLVERSIVVVIAF